MFAEKHSIPIFVLGGGSNIVVADAGIASMVIKVETKGVSQTSLHGKYSVLSVGAGEEWDAFVDYTVRNDLYGLENLSLIPGTVGASPVQNIGAYGTEVGDAIEWVKVFDTKTMQIKKMSREECSFAYRNSIFKQEKHRNLIVVCVAFRLEQSGKARADYKDVDRWLRKHRIQNPTAADVRRAVVAIRTKKLPGADHGGTVGSFFKNPVVAEEVFKELRTRFPGIPLYAIDEGIKISLAWILDKVCGLRGVRHGDVGLWERQPLVIVNYGVASSQEIKNFSEWVRAIVKEKTGIMPEYEVSFIGNFD